MKIKENLYLLPSDKAPQRNQIVIELDGTMRLAHNHFNGPVAHLKPQHLYITDESEIGKGDWYIKITGKLYRAGSNDWEDWLSLGDKKVVSSTDPQLWPAVTEIRLSFVEDFINKYRHFPFNYVIFPV